MTWIGLFFLVMYMFGPRHLSYANTDTMKQGQELRDFQNLVSSNGLFTLRFFSLDNGTVLSSAPRYIGICFKKRKLEDAFSVVWVANRENAIPDTSGVLMMADDGILKFTYGGGELIPVSKNQPIETSESNVSATLLNSGNLVVREVNSNGEGKTILWQSFDYPTDTLLPEMKVGFNLKTGLEWSLYSWVSEQVPSRGAFKLGLDGPESRELIIWRRGEVYWRSGVWKNGSFQLAPELTNRDGGYEVRYEKNANETYFSFSAGNRSSIQLIWVLDWGTILRCILDLDTSKLHNLEDTGPCGIDINNLTAVPLKEKPSTCRAASDKFVPKKGYYTNKTDLRSDDYNKSLDIYDCHTKCWESCDCIAYKSSFDDNGTGCTFWKRGSKFISGESFGIYIVSSELNEDSTAKRKRWWIWFILAVAVLALFLSAILCNFMTKKNRTGKRETNQDKSFLSLTSKTTPSDKLFDGNKQKHGKKKGQELQMFSFWQITTATNNFSSSSKLGEGGFGPVYKGILPDGQQIAVKRLSRTSGQGLLEFKNEITLIAELQHINLVKLLGYCIEGEEKMLIYEYMPNKSLDSFLFDRTKKGKLDWQTRFSIIEGISQGLLYLHKYSRLRVIHRDLKASNILLDDQMNPKISDFGLARIFGHNEYEATTNRVVGTYGYMSPEYAMNGIFSIKSDVYSFGVLLLEIISGLRNTAFSTTSCPLTLIEQAWNLWSADACLELVDKSADFSCRQKEVLRHVHIGLLCVQECAMDRPTMSDVVVMLTNESTSLPYPKQPGFYITRYQNGTTLPDGKSDPRSVYNVTVTEMDGR